MDIEKKGELLRQFSALASLNQAELQAIGAFFTSHQLHKNEYIYQCGDRLTHLYFLCSGKVKVYHTNPHGKEWLVHLHTGNDVFPTIGHYLHTRTYPSHTLVVEDVHLLSLPVIHIESIMSTSPTMHQFFFSHLGEQMLDYQHRLEDKTLGSTMEQIVGLLLRLGRTNGEKDKHTGEVRLQEVFHNTVLASMIGMTRETISRNMHVLYDQKAIRKDASGKLILNLANLQALLEEASLALK